MATLPAFTSPPPTSRPPPSSLNAATSQQQPPSQPQTQLQNPSSIPSRTVSGLRYPTNKKTIYDRNLNRARTAELSRASFAFLFVEMISYAQRRITNISDLEKRLNNQGYPLGLRLLDLLLYREPPRNAATLRPTRLLPLLQLIHTTLWKHLFGRPADTLERSATNAAEYMITDNEPLVNQYISVPKEMSQLNCAAFVAGIIEGVCDGAGFSTDGVTAHWVEGPGGGGADAMWPGKTIFLIRFKKEVLEREEILGKGG